MEKQRRARVPAEDDVVSAEEVLSVYSGKAGDEKEKRKVLKVRKFATEPAFVRVNAGVTKNMGNYESLRLDVSISMPCYAEDIDNMLPVVADKIAALLDEEILNYTKGGD